MSNDNITITNTTEQSEGDKSNSWQKMFSFTLTHLPNKGSLVAAAVELTIKYNGKNNFKLGNVLYQIQYMVQDESGTILPLYKKPPILLVNKPGDIDEKIDFDFMINAIKKNNKDIDNIHQEVNNPEIVFTKNSQMSYLLDIVPLMKKQDGTAGQLPAGNYKVKVCFSLVPSNAAKYKPWLNLCHAFNTEFRR